MGNIIIAANDADIKTLTHDFQALTEDFKIPATTMPWPVNNYDAEANLDFIFNELMVHPEQSIERAAITHVANCTKLNPEYRVGTPIGDKETLTLQTLMHAEMGFNLIREFEEDFFKDLPNYDREALIMAAICDEFVKIPLSKDAEKYQSILDRALKIWNEACDIGDNGLEDDEKPTPEAWCLASIDVLRQLDYMSHDFNYIPLKEAKATVTHAFPIAGSIVKEDTELGLFIYKALDKLDAMVESRTSASKTTPLFVKDQPHL